MVSVDSGNPTTTIDFRSSLWGCSREELLGRLVVNLRDHIYECPSQFINDNIFLCKGQSCSEQHIADIARLLPTAQLHVDILSMSEQYSEESKSFPYIPENTSLAEQVTIYGDWFLRNNRFYAESANSPIWMYHENNGLWQQDGEQFIQNILANLQHRKFKTSLVNEVRNYVCYKSYREGVELGGCKDKIVVRNGALNIKTGEFYTEFEAEEYHISGIPVAYDPAAKCPEFLTFLKQVTGTEHDRMAIEEFLGYCLYKTNLYEIVLLLNGSGRNGKTVFLDLLKRFLGEKNITSVSPQLLERSNFASSRLQGKLANICADIPSQSLKYTGYLKMLTSTDLVPAERKHRDGFDFENYAKFVFSCNTVPESYDDTDAFYRRWRIIDFPNKFEPGNDNFIPKEELLEKIANELELSGILNLALEGLERLRTNHRLTGTTTVEERRSDYLIRSDPAHYFFDRFLTQDTYAEPIEKTVLYNIYVEWCHAINKTPISDSWFGKKIVRHVSFASERKIRIRTGDGKEKRKLCWVGIAIDYDSIREDMGVNVIPSHWVNGDSTRAYEAKHSEDQQKLVEESKGVKLYEKRWKDFLSRTAEYPADFVFAFFDLEQIYAERERAQLYRDLEDWVKDGRVFEMKTQAKEGYRITKELIK